MKTKTPNAPLLGVLLGTLAAQAAWAQVAAPVASPDSRISAAIASSPGGALTYSVSIRGQRVLAPSALGIVVDGQNLGQSAILGRPTTRVVRETYPIRGAHTLALNHYREAIFPVAAGAGRTPWQLEVRVYNDGAAFRYRVPGAGARRINGEVSTWKLPPESVIWFQTSTKEYERPFIEQQSDSPAVGAIVGAPITAKLPNGLGYAVLSEANLVNYSDMALQVESPSTFRATFDKDATGWNHSGEILSPWRVTLLVPTLNALANSDLLKNLCPPAPPELANARWIQPGRSTWHWMVTGRPLLAQQRQWVDWTKQLGFEYYLIDDGWVDWRAEGRDQWACLKDVVDYARTQNVRIWAWVHSKEIRDTASRDAYFQKARAAGVVGLKMDFPERPNVEWVNWYDDTLRDLARHQLMANFHGSVKPTGRERTWPHELTREAILGRESGKLPALHDAALPFTRFVQGHADFTPTDFRSGRLGGGSWAHELAQAIVYTSPFFCYGGDPADYLDNPAVDILKAIPATWDETVVLSPSEVGRTAAYARRKGQNWFIGVVNGNEARPLRLSLSFLGAGSYRVERLSDVPERNDTWSRTQGTATRRDVLSANLRRNGGFVARLIKVR